MDYRINSSFAVAVNASLLHFLSCSPTITPPNIPPSGTTIFDTSAIGFYLTPSTPSTNTVIVRNSVRPPHWSSASCDLLLPSLPVSPSHIIQDFRHNFMGIEQ